MAAIARLRERFGDRCSTSDAILDQHASDESALPPARPDMVVAAATTGEVADALRICDELRVPVVASGARSSLEGHVLSLRGGVALDLTGLDRIVEVNVDDLDCRVEAGVTRSQLEAHLRTTGLFFPVDPGADATLGGMVATGASGTNAVRYGTMRTNVLGLTVVLADGRVVRTGTRARKSSAGYDLTRLIVGSEGTLGIVTEVQLRLYGVPETVVAATCSFDDLAGAVETVIRTVQFGIPVARIELLDEVTMQAVTAYHDLPPADPLPALFLEFHGAPRAVAEQVEQVEQLAREHGGRGFKHAAEVEERNRLWRARHDALYACLALRPGARGISTDVCVPISRLAECLLETRADIDAAGITAPLVGHAGDGNFHSVLLVDPDDASEVARVEDVHRRMIDRALRLGGTCSGEHGIGWGKRADLAREHPTAIGLMRQLKSTLDPNGILNPGKVVPDADPILDPDAMR